MKAKELRIGNAYMSTKFGVPITLTTEDIYEMVIAADGAEIEPEKIVNPIPLTEEWLERLGFEKTVGDNPFPYTKRIDSWLTIEIEDDMSIGFSSDMENDFMSPSLKTEYVHQIYNLFYALTGEELRYENTRK